MNIANDEVLTAGEVPKLSANALRVLEARYLRRNEQRRVIETPDELFLRVADAVASAERLLGNAAQASYWRDEFYQMLVSLDFLPNSPTLMNAGTPLGQLSACFVLPVPDTMEGIFNALKDMALVQRTGGGTGFSFSRLRPKGDWVASTGGESSGPVSFMKIFDSATENIKQGGKRRGANMGVLRVDHPDILEFINAKLDGKTLQNFNLSVGATDAFLRSLREGGTFSLRHPRTGRALATVPARRIFDAIVEAAWQTGDPGLLFLDAINRANPTPLLGDIEATNPCGEVPLLANEACNLGSINLARMFREGDESPRIDWEKLARIVRRAVRFLDNVVEVNHYPTPAIEEISRTNRKLGLGVMGFAEALIRLGIPYDSKDAGTFAEWLMQFIAEEALSASEELATERGVFKNWPGSVCEARGVRVRNATRTAIAPTGTIGMIADTTPSIEPLFALAYRHVNVLDGQTVTEVNPMFHQWVADHPSLAEPWAQQVLKNGNLNGLSGIPEEFKRLFITALEIPPEQHLQIQAAFQRHVDNSVSKTINLPAEATRESIAQAYLRAWELGLKGVTIYRYRSKTSQVLELGTAENAVRCDYGARCDPEECRV